jgi:YVTN family beta-propeller protein
MGNAKYIGRVGALAVALGIGTAVATTPWVAVAEPAADSSPASGSSSSDASSAAGSTNTDDSKPAKSGDISGGPDTSPDAPGAAEPADEDPDAETDGHTPEPTAGEEVDTESETDPESNTPQHPPVYESPATEPVALTEPSNNDGPPPSQPVSVDPPHAADPDAGVADSADGDAGSVHEPAIKVPVTPASSTAPAVRTGVPATAMAAQLVPVAQPLPVAESPVSVVTGLVSGLLAWVGLGPALTNAPAAPVEPPLLWGLVGWVRRQVQHTLFNRTLTTAYNPAENSQSVDGVITGNLHAVDPDGDPLTFTVAQAPEHGTLVVNPDGTFTYTPGREFARIGSDSFTITVDDSAAYRLSGPAGLIQDLLHRAAQVVGLAGPDSIDSHPSVHVIPRVIATIEVGDVPRDVAITPDGSRAYVANQFDGTVSVIDTATNTVTATIPVGDYPFGVAVSPNGSRVYVTNADSDTVSVIDAATNTVTATIPVGNRPLDVAITADGTRAYVANLYDGTVSVIDTSTNSVTTTISGVDWSPSEVAISPDGARLYVANVFDNTVSVINTATNTITNTINVGNEPTDVAVSPDGARVYVANFDDDTVSVINTATNTVIATITVGDAANGVAVSPNGKRVYVANYVGDTVSVINTTTNTVIATVDVGSRPEGLAVSPDGTRVYVTNVFDSTVSVLSH